MTTQKTTTNSKTPIHVLIKALRKLARDIQSDDGVANATIYEAADVLEDLEAENQRLREVLKKAFDALEYPVVLTTNEVRANMRLRAAKKILKSIATGETA